jgi:parallel beta-helix repeat protein
MTIIRRIVMREKSPLRVFVTLALAIVILVGSNNFLMHVSQFSIGVAAVRGDDPLPRGVFLNYTFEGLPLNQTPPGWVVNPVTAGYFIVTNETSHSGQDSAKFVDNSSAAVFTAFSYFSQQNDTIVVSFSVKMPNNTGIHTGLEVSVDDGNFHGANIIFNDTAIQYFDGSKGLVTLRSSYIANRWYRIEFIMDIPSNVYNIHIDDHLEATNARFNGTVTAIQRIALAESDIYNPTQPGSLLPVAYIDDVLGVQGLNVPDDFPTIQAAVNAASPGDTIVLNASRIYFENVVIPANKNGITLEGQDAGSTIIDGEFNMTAPFCILLKGCANVTIVDLTLRDSYNGGAQVEIAGNNDSVSACIIIGGLGSGISITGSNASITNNLIQDNPIGIDVVSGQGTFVQNNTILNNTQVGLRVQKNGSHSLIYGNRFVKNTVQAQDQGTLNTWDDGYPYVPSNASGGGNYWSDFTNCTDIYSGKNQDIGPNCTVPSPDGICDQPYQTGINSKDNYPLYLIQSVTQTPALTHANCTSQVFDKSVQYSDTVNVTVDTLQFVQITNAALLVNYTFGNGTTGNLKIPPKIQNSIITFSIPAFKYNTTVRYVVQVLADGSNWLNTTNYPIPFPYLVDDMTPPIIKPGGVADSPDQSQFIIVLATVTEPVNASGVAEVYVSYVLNSTVWTGQMTNIGDGNYTAVIPKQQGGTTLNYTFSAVDNAGNWGNSTPNSQYIRSIGQLSIQYKSNIPYDPFQIDEGENSVAQTINDNFNISNIVSSTDDNLFYNITILDAGPWFTLTPPISGVLAGGQKVIVHFTIVTPSDPGLHVAVLSILTNGTIPNWGMVINFTVANIIIDESSASSQWPNRVNVGAFQLVYFHTEWALNCSDATGGSVTINSTSTGELETTNATGWAKFQVNSSTPAMNSYTVTGVTFNYVTSFTQTATSPVIAWDRVKVVLSMGNNNYTDVDSAANISWNQSYYELDRILGFNTAPFVGSVVFNDSLIRDHPARAWVGTSSIIDLKYNLTAFESNSIDVAWDEIKIIAAGVSSSQASVNQTEYVWYIAVYELENTVFRGENGSLILSDGTKNYTMNWSSDDKEMWQADFIYLTPGTRTFQISGVRDDVYHLTKIDDSLDPMNITWGEVEQKPWWETLFSTSQSTNAAHDPTQPTQPSQTPADGAYIIWAVVIVMIVMAGSILALLTLMSLGKKSAHAKSKAKIGKKKSTSTNHETHSEPSTA